MKRTTLLKTAAALLLAPALLTAGCKSAGSGEGSVGLDRPVMIVESVNGNSPALKTLGTMLIKTQAQYDALGDPDIVPGGLDFSKYDLIIVALGEQPTGGYSVDIESIQQSGNELAVTGKATRPGPDDAVTQAITYPYDTAIIANTDATQAVPYID